MDVKRKEKRKKSKNFTNHEISLFLKILTNYIDIIENKKTDAFTQKEKNEAWETLTKKFNASNAYKRTCSQMKTFYDNYKRKKRKEFNAAENKFEYKTNMDVLTKKFDVRSEKLINLLKEKLKPDENVFDEEDELIITEIKNVNETIPSLESTTETLDSTNTQNINEDYNQETEEKRSSKTIQNSSETTEKIIKQDYQNEYLQLKIQRKKLKLERLSQNNQEQHELFLLQKTKLQNKIRLQEIRIKAEELNLQQLENK